MKKKANTQSRRKTQQKVVSASLSLLGSRFLLFLFKFSQLLFERLVVVRRETQFLEKVIALERHFPVFGLLDLRRGETIGPGQAGLPEVGLPQVGLLEVGPVQVGPLEFGPPQNGLLEVGLFPFLPP